MRLARAVLVLTATIAYLGFVFRLDERAFRSAGLGDWIDPYFINGLLEHWFHVAASMANPASPPIFHPVPHVIGYSHGLVLFAPFYVPLRLWLHPFLAYTGAIFAVMLVGTAALYAWLRHHGRSFVEAVALCALFVSSPNVMNGPTGVWTQRASVFLIPPILLLAARSAAPAARRPGASAFIAGLLALLLYVQDFYTAQFAMVMTVWFVAAALAVHQPDAIRRHAATFLHPRSRGKRIALAIAAVAALSAGLILASGGGETRVFGIRMVARDWTRPALVAVVAVVFAVWRDPQLRLSFGAAVSHMGLRGFLAGAAVGTAVFLWMYLPAFRERSGFPAEELWRGLSDRSPYWSYRPFIFAAALAALAWWPWFRVDRAGRAYAAWLIAGSVFVWLVPLKFGDRALWMDVLRPLPGFAAIRDPARIIYLYELAVVIAAALILRQAPDWRVRAAAVVVAFGLVLGAPNRERFYYARDMAMFDRWVAAPIAIDPGCRSFFLKGASDAYMARSPHMAGLYGGDATFVALTHDVPTLNGYSAWFPPDWELANPQEATYPGRVRSWIRRNRLEHVCALDIDARRMEPDDGR